VLLAGDQPVVTQLLAFSQMCVVGGRGDRPDSDDACVGWHLRRARAVADPEHGDVVVPGVVAFIDLVGEPPNNLETRGLVEVGRGAPTVAVPGGEHGGLTVGVVDEPSGGAGVRGQAVGVVDAYADTWGEGRAPGWWLRSKSGGSAAAVAAVITPQQLIAAAVIAARAHVVVCAILPIETPGFAEGEIRGGNGRNVRCSRLVWDLSRRLVSGVERNKISSLEFDWWDVAR